MTKIKRKLKVGLIGSGAIARDQHLPYWRQLEAEGRVALLIDNRSNDETDLQQAAAVTVLGACTEALGEERSKLSDWFLNRHPAMADFVRSPGCAVMKVDVRYYYLVTRFQNVIELHVRDGECRDSHKTPA